jgi:Flp pilus assembly protein CpaB
MSQWAFVIAAYALALGGVAALVASSLASMRRAEAEADQLQTRK